MIKISLFFPPSLKSPHNRHINGYYSTTWHIFDLERRVIRYRLYFRLRSIRLTRTRTQTTTRRTRIINRHNRLARDR